VQGRGGGKRLAGTIRRASWWGAAGQHKWQKLKLAVIPRRWRELNQGLWVNGAKSLATISTIVGILSGIVSTTLSVVS
jgi:hypothetical protein